MDVVEFDYDTVPRSGLNGRRGYQPRGNRWDYDHWAAPWT